MIKEIKGEHNKSNDTKNKYLFSMVKSCYCFCLTMIDTMIDIINKDTLFKKLKINIVFKVSRERVHVSRTKIYSKIQFNAGDAFQ